MNPGRLTKGLAVASLTGVAVLGMSASALAQTYEGPGRAEQAPGQGNKAECPADGRDGNPGRCGRGAQVSASSGRGTFDPGSQGRFGVESSFRQLGTFARDLRVGADGAAVVSFTVPPFLEDGRHHVVFLGEKDGLPVRVSVPFDVVGGVATVAPSSVSTVGGEPFTVVAAGAPGSTAAGTSAPGTAAAGTAAAGTAAAGTAAAGTAAAGTAAAGTAAAGTDGTAAVSGTGDSGTASTTGTGTTVAGRALPRTGSDSLVELTAAGVALVAVGGIVAAAARRRREDVGSLAL